MEYYAARKKNKPTLHASHRWILPIRNEKSRYEEERLFLLCEVHRQATLIYGYGLGQGPLGVDHQEKKALTTKGHGAWG